MINKTAKCAAHSHQKAASKETKNNNIEPKLLVHAKTHKVYGADRCRIVKEDAKRDGPV